MANGTMKQTGWAFAGTSTSGTQNVTFPSTATELFISVKNGGNAKATFPTMLPLACVPDDATVLCLGGYYYASNDYAYCYLNFSKTGRTVSLRGCRYGDNTSGTVYVYYR